MEAREFHFAEGSSNKFWKISVEGTTQTVQYGRIGTAGQTSTKEFESAAAAKTASDKLIAEKVKKGYSEISVAATSTAVAPDPAPHSPTQDEKESCLGAQRKGRTITPSGKESSAATPVLVRDGRLAEGRSAMPFIGVESKATPPHPSPENGEPAAEEGYAEASTAADVKSETEIEADLLTIERSIDLSDDDYVRAGMRPRKPKKKPAPPRFDLSDAIARAKRCNAGRGWQSYFDQAHISPVLTLAEARFWYQAICRQVRTRGLAADISAVWSWLEKQAFDQGLSDEEFRLEFASLTWGTPPEMATCMTTLLGLHRFIEFIAYVAKEGLNPQPLPQIADGFRRFVLPYLDSDETEEMRRALRTAYASYSPNVGPHIELLYLGACVGLASELRAAVDRWPDRPTAQTYWWELDHTRDVVLGVGDSSEVERHFRRMKMTVAPAEYARAWLAATQYSGLDVIADTVQLCTEKNEAEVLARVLLRVHAPEAALPMLRLYHESKAPRIAREWFDAHPKHAVAGLIPVAASSGPYAVKAADMLADMARRGHRGVVAAHIAAQPEAVASRLSALALVGDDQPAYEALNASNTPEKLSAAIPKSVKPRPGDPTSAELPPIVVVSADGPRRLNDVQVTGLLATLQKSTLEAPGEFIAAVNAVAEPRSLDAFAWALFERWLTDGAGPKEKWQMLTIGHLGGDICALKLAALVRKWPGEAQHARAVTGLECLRAIGSDTALMQINGIANKVSFKGIKQRAAECMDEIAKACGMTRPELEDRIIPDCDLDERGSRAFDFGPRQFRFVLSPEMKAMVKDEAGKVASDLPKPNSKDDAEKSAEAVAEWKLLKKQVTEVAKIQAARLEQAMITGRRWSAPEFEQLLVRHPLMTNLVRLLLWGVYDARGGVAGSFRVTEDQSFADSSDSEYTLMPDASVGVVHPLQLTADNRASWGEIWSDYEIVPPFPQLGRPIYALPDDEGEVVEMKRFGQKRLPCATVVFTLDKLGWSRAQPADAGGFSEHTKPFYGANVTAVAQYEPGCAVGWITEADPQCIEDVFFIPGIVLPGEWWPDHKQRLKWGDVNPVAVSEVLADLTAIVAKAG